MGGAELIAALYRTGAQRAAEARSAAEQEAERLRLERSERLTRLREELRQSAATLEQDAIRNALADARARALRMRLRTEQAIAERLFATASKRLPALRTGDYAGTFRRLVRELPPLAWRIVRVNPADVALAQEQFPEAEIVADGSIAGGVDAEAEGGMVRVVNTFEKRLERAWGELLPVLIREAYQEATDGGPADAG